MPAIKFLNLIVILTYFITENEIFLRLRVSQPVANVTSRVSTVLSVMLAFLRPSDLSVVKQHRWCDKSVQSFEERICLGCFFIFEGVF